MAGFSLHLRDSRFIVRTNGLVIVRAGTRLRWGMRRRRSLHQIPARQEDNAYHSGQRLLVTTSGLKARDVVLTWCRTERTARILRSGGQFGAGDDPPKPVTSISDSRRARVPSDRRRRLIPSQRAHVRSMPAEQSQNGARRSGRTASSESLRCAGTRP